MAFTPRGRTANASPSSLSTFLLGLEVVPCSASRLFLSAFFPGRAVSGSTHTTGNYVRRRVTSALSITVPSGQAIGAPSGQGFAFYLEAIDNGGIVELAVFNPVVGGAAATSIICPQESKLISTTAIASAPSGGVHYSASARVGVAFRTLARLEYASLVTAGTWASAPANIDIVKPWSKRPGDIVQSRSQQASGAFSTTSTAVQSTNLSDSITPLSPASLVRARVVGTLTMTAASQTITAQIYRGATGIGPSPTNYLNTTAAIYNFNTAVAIEVLDAPGVASAVTYSEKIRISGGTGGTSGDDMLYLDDVWV